MGVIDGDCIDLSNNAARALIFGRISKSNCERSSPAPDAYGSRMPAAWRRMRLGCVPLRAAGMTGGTLCGMGGRRKGRGGSGRG